MVDTATIANIVNSVIGLFGGASGTDGPSKSEWLTGVTILNQQAEEVFQHLKFLNEQGITEQNVRANELETHISDEIREQNAQILDWLILSGTTILDAISHTNAVIGNIETNDNSAILNAILNNTGSLINTNNSVISSILLPTQSSIYDLQNQAFNYQLAIDNNFTGVFDVLGNILGGLNNQAQQSITNQIIIDDSIYGSVLNSIENLIGRVLAENASVIDGLTGVFSELVGGLMSVIALENVEGDDQVKRIADFMEILNNPSLENLNRMGSGDLQGFGGLMGSGVIEAITNKLGLASGGYRERVNESLYGHKHPADSDYCGLIEWESQWVDTSVPNILIDVFVWIITAAMTPLNASQVKANIAMQNYRRCNPDALMQIGDIANSWRRGLIDFDKAATDIEKQGFTHDDAETLLQSSSLFPTLDMVLASWLREDISDTVKDQYLAGLGYDRFTSDRLTDLAFFIPPVQDLVTMSVREAFDPEIVARNGQDDDFPQAFGDWAKKQGVSDFWAHKYWQAHWRLPSEQMGFEMLHRGIIDEEKLRGLMQALDIMPGWRDEIIAISYTPFSRVDIRRMHKLGVMDAAGVEKAYRDIGYSPEDAKLQLEFVEALNEDEDLVTLDVASDLSRSTIIQFFKKGIIDETLTTALLLQAGINAVAAALFIDTAKLDMELDRRDDELALILTKYRVGDLTFEEANDSINSLGLEPLERQRASLELLKTKEVITKQPSKADLGKFYEAKLITGPEYIEGMQRIGYSLQWSTKFYSLLTLEEGGANE